MELYVTHDENKIKEEYQRLVEGFLCEKSIDMPLANLASPVLSKDILKVI